jgi:hypothetical protein
MCLLDAMQVADLRRQVVNSDQDLWRLRQASFYTCCWSWCALLDGVVQGFPLDAWSHSMLWMFLLHGQVWLLQHCIDVASPMLTYNAVMQSYLSQLARARAGAASENIWRTDVLFCTHCKRMALDVCQPLYFFVTLPDTHACTHAGPSCCNKNGGQGGAEESSAGNTQ